MLSNEKISDLCLKLATLLHAGLDIGQSASLMHPKDPETKKVVMALSEGADRGDKLHEILKATNEFPSYVTGLLETGDMAGKTEDALMSLSHYYHKQDVRGRQIRSALLYPAVLMLVMIAVIVTLLARVLPVFDSVYASLGGSMTGIAGGLLHMGEFLNRIMPCLCGVLAAVVLVLALFAGHQGFRSSIIQIWQHRFGDAGVSRKLNNAKLAQALSMGMESGMRLEDAMDLAAELASDTPSAARRCRNCAEKLRDDCGLAEALLTSGILPESSCELLALGQHGGTGDVAMAEIAERLSVDADNAIDGLVSKVEPAIVLLTSIMVGMILLSVMLPLLDIMSVLG